MKCTEMQNKTKITGHRKNFILLGINMHPKSSTEYNKERCLNNQASLHIKQVIS